MVSLLGHVRNAIQSLKERRSSLADLSDALGIPPDKRRAVQEHGTYGALLGMLPVRPTSGGLFDVVEDGATAAIVAAYHHLDDDPADLVALRLDHRPQRALRLLGISSALGWHAINAARTASLPLLKSEQAVLTVHETPLAWLRSGCVGACVLERRCTPTVLADIDAYQTTREFAPRLHELLHQDPPHIGQVLVPESESLAA